MRPVVRRSGVTRHRAGTVMPFEKILFGIYRNRAGGHSATWLANKIRLDRGDTSSGSPEIVWNEGTPAQAVTQITNSLAAGLQPFMIINIDDGELLSKVSLSGFSTAAKNIIKAVEEAHPGKTRYEIVNEPQFKGPQGKSNAKDYANICKATYEAVEAAGFGHVPMLVTCFETYEIVSSEGVKTGTFSSYTSGGGWMKDFVTAWPEAPKKVNGLVSHNYGAPKVAPSGEGNNNIRSAQLHHETALSLGFVCASLQAHWATEFGYWDESIGGPQEFGGAANAAAQASKLKEALEEMLKFSEEGWFAGCLYFADNTGEPWGIWGKEAATIYEAFALAHGQ